MSARNGGQDGLLRDLRKQVTLLEDDLRARSESVEEYRDRLTDEYTRAYAADRTAATYESWRDERVTQVAAAWVLGCVFVRFCEDNGLIERAWLAGVGERLKDAEDHDAAFFAANPEKNDRDWIVAAFDHLAGTNPTVAGLFDRGHNPLWEIAPSYEAATALLKFWRRVDSDGELIHSFVDSDLDTRFLGDLYQDLSEHARKTYALLQTPAFVEEFILDLTLEPAVEEFGLEPVVKIREHGVYRELPAGLRTIDPACGSGHFLLGLFERLLAKWRNEDKSADEWTLIRRALNAVHGCDKNPFAVSIARFRLLIAALKAADAGRFDTAPGFPINVVVGDSLIHGRGAPKRESETMFSLSGENLENFFYRPEDIGEYAERCDLMTRDTYHVVVGNPPYITVKDKQENLNYRVYESCSGKYALSVPFAERLFQLAVRTSGSNRDAGYVGQITANSFMKREFGKKLIEDFFRLKVHLTHVIDTSGAYIPGHGTPTAILAGRNYVPRPDEPIRAVLGVRGEPTQPEEAAEGLVWTAITKQVNTPGTESDWVGVTDLPRADLAQFPWSLSGGGSAELLASLESQPSRCNSKVSTVGRTTHTGLDLAFYLPQQATRTRGLRNGSVPVIAGEDIRDFIVKTPNWALFPYDEHGDPRELELHEYRYLWPNRTALRGRLDFGETPEERGLRWFDHSMFFARRYRSPLSVGFPFVATHNHFTLDRGGKVFNRTGPAIKLPDESSEDEHLMLLGVLNSSTACFWLKQVSQSKGNGGIGGGISDELWEHRFEFTGTKLQEFPLPTQLPLPLGRTLDALAQELAAQEPSTVCTAIEPPTRARLDSARDAWTRTRQRMIALQEELDWEVYHSYGLLTDAEKARLTAPSPAPTTIPQVNLGERAFEIVLARKQAAGEIETAWFDRHGSTPVTEIPAHWPNWYQDIVQARIDTITSRRDIALIERPECKRRWATDPWEKREKAALRTWLLDRCEDKSLWFHVLNDFEQPRTLTVGQLTDELENQPDAKAILNTASLYATHLGKPNLSLTHVVQDVIDAEHVPYLAAYRYKDTGLRKRAQWEDVWEQQREEDRTGERLNIPVPPKYTSADFVKQSYWSNRGKLDVPKERFVSYPDASPGSDPTLLLGWAGWDQRDQATALLNIVSERRKQQDWSGEQLVPLLAGINELMPWLRQWFGEVDDEWGEESAAEEFQSFLDGELAREQLTPAALTEWRPAKKTRARKTTATTKTAKKKAAEDDE
ncbi:BREX-2 system adenine-specific DNA-methyltransferase PglX [Streptomyces sioyaensis]|uniref:site-specific DNA-methyltransferase (adenine-specific) n=1 Tax=Streptomyces sioyaensis TaxID=67364 RepID=A0A4Q1R8A0_9ACTN|nr:BREX-2 system adenine-specific DNA-methyltransferase PglX [Streptomyces sioyaensis]MBM4793024.1 BREX-2 system adenine-specific DNA-methyltransferase PglX [Streptomyces sioyaensis]RXS69604.1 BREX-2 system adenine-specific DNA-methyltransferase PglX [Streptomyces sioyaensis]